MNNDNFIVINNLNLIYKMRIFIFPDNKILPRYRYVVMQSICTFAKEHNLDINHIKYEK